MDLVKRRKLSSADRILTALAISRMVLFWIASLDWWIFVQYRALWMTGNVLKIINITWIVVSHYSIWLTSTLSIFYFLKIANFSNSIFLYLKWRVGKVVSLTLLVALVLMFVSIVCTNADIAVMIDAYKGNLSYSSQDSAQFSTLLPFIKTVLLFIPFTVNLTTFLLLIFSLRKHLKRMQHNVRGYGDASTLAHTKALQIVMASLLLYIIFFLSLLVKAWNSQLLMKNFIFFLCQTAANAFHSCHSCVLILGNSKLRQACCSVLRRLGHGSNDADPSGP
ncbi:PREDICTED: taste receptor type 2 member 140-like [Chinchilla lanigera]|uniref:taste receptor type 2 member 140-like n=1 Tax=Chinchilla lanigera TaxID=34839 RepID=UPI0006984DA4|nr:PREDICTED: taste receptor type 2 member 140-like [Chinchilla lanigera]